MTRRASASIVAVAGSPRAMRLVMVLKWVTEQASIAERGEALGRLPSAQRLARTGEVGVVHLLRERAGLGFLA